MYNNQINIMHLDMNILKLYLVERNNLTTVVKKINNTN